MAMALHRGLDKEDFRMISEQPLPWEKLRDASVLVTGGNGLIASAFVDALLQCEAAQRVNVSVTVLCRSREKAEMRFGAYIFCCRMCVNLSQRTKSFNTSFMLPVLLILWPFQKRLWMFLKQIFWERCRCWKAPGRIIPVCYIFLAVKYMAPIRKIWMQCRKPIRVWWRLCNPGPVTQKGKEQRRHFVPAMGSSTVWMPWRPDFVMYMVLP